MESMDNKLIKVILNNSYGSDYRRSKEMKLIKKKLKIKSWDAFAVSQKAIAYIEEKLNVLQIEEGEWEEKRVYKVTYEEDRWIEESRIAIVQVDTTHPWIIHEYDDKEKIMYLEARANNQYVYEDKVY